jgi:hypothetical protein
MKQRLNEIFNGLSSGDRWALRAAAAMETITADFRDDTKNHPWKFPFYAAYLAAMLVPIPLLPGHGVLMAGLVIAYARAGLTPGARELKDRLREAFTAESLVREHRSYIEKDRGGGHAFRVEKWQLSESAGRQSLHNMRRLFDHAIGAAGGFLLGGRVERDTTIDDGNDGPPNIPKPPENHDNPPVP